MRFSKPIWLLIGLLFLTFSLDAQQKAAYKIYTSKGKKVTYKKMLKTLQKQDIILFGEYHNNPIAHWLQLEVLQDLQPNHSMVLGLEMLERDAQPSIDLYLKDQIDQVALDTLVDLWSNYKTDYKPTVDFAKSKNIPVVSTNIPRRYASKVYREGGFAALDNLSAEEKSWIAPLPIPFDPDLPTYKEMLNMMGGHGSTDLVKAQAIKDATMAHFILDNFQKGSLFLHLNGSYHSDFYEGILWYMKLSEPDLNYTTISTVSQEDISRLESDNKNRANFIICVDADMTTTY